MKRIAYALLALTMLSACDLPPSQYEVLVCAAEGRETYRSQPSRYWKNAYGTWFGGGASDQYRQSNLESCWTVPA